MSLVAVASLEAAYALPAGRKGAEAKRVLDDVAKNRLAPALAEQLDAFGDDDESIWFIRRLDVLVSTALDDIDEGGIARAWARATAEALGRSLAAETADIVRFADRPELLAGLVLDLADGRAASRWYFAASDYGALASRAASAAIRDALLADATAGLRALGRVWERRGLDRVVRALDEPSARSVLDAWSAEPASEVSEDALPVAFAAALAVRPLLALGPDTRERDALTVVAAAERAHAARALIGAAREAIDLALELRAGRPSGMTALAGAEAPPARPPHARRDPALVAEAARVFAPETQPGLLRSPVGNPPAAAASRYAGVFLLVESLRDLALPSFAEGAGRAPVIARAIVGEHWATAMRDATLLHAAGCDAAALDTGPEPLAARGLVDRLVELRRADLRHLVLELVAGAPPLLVVRDALHDCWLAATPAEAQGEILAEQAASLVESLGEPDALLVRGIEAALPLPALREDDDLPPSLARWLRNARPAAGEVEALGFASDPDVALAAHAVLRGFAARLAGFGWSAAAYLRQTFLEGIGAVAAAEAAIVVDLPPSPLGIVLRMAGFDGRAVSAPWLDRPVVLRLPSP